MKKTAALVLGLLMIGLVFAAGCIGGGSTTQTASSPTTSTESPQPSSSASTTTHPATTSTHTGTASTHTQTTSTHVETSTQTASGTTTETATETTTETVTTTSTPTEKAYWTHPWEYAPVVVGDERYLITYYKYDYRVQPNQTAPVYEYIVEKSTGKAKIHVYGQDMTGSKVDLGEKEVYEYVTVVMPVKAAVLDDKLTIRLWFTSNRSDAFLYPWDVLWMSYISPYSQSKEFVGMKFEYKDSSFLLTNPVPFQSGLFPYFEGNQDAFSDISEDLGYLYLGWAATLNFGIWYEWESYNLLVPQKGTWSDDLGHSWEWSTEPDGTVEYFGVVFKLVNFAWKYTGTAEGISMSGKGKVSPYLPLLVEGDGHYSYKDPKTGDSLIIYAYLKLEDLRLEKVD